MTELPPIIERLDALLESDAEPLEKVDQTSRAYGELRALVLRLQAERDELIASAIAKPLSEWRARMTDDRAELGARIAEAMGWEYDADSDAWIVPEDTDPIEDWIEAEALATWWGYGIVDAWMREQGWNRATFHDGDGCRVVWSMPGQRHSYHFDTPDHDEPLAALQAVEKALEGKDQ